MAATVCAVVHHVTIIQMIAVTNPVVDVTFGVSIADVHESDYFKNYSKNTSRGMFLVDQGIKN